MKTKLTPRLLDLMRQLEQQSIGMAAMLGEAEKPVPPKKALPKPDPKDKAKGKDDEKPDFKKEKNPSSKDPKKPEPEPAPPREIDMKDIPKTEGLTRADKAARASANAEYMAKRLQILRTNQAILKTGKCPDCGTKLYRNLSMTGWWQCGHLGATGFQKEPSDQHCSFQFFYDPSEKELAALREATTINPSFTQQHQPDGYSQSYGTIPEEDASSVTGQGYGMTPEDDVDDDTVEEGMDSLTKKLMEDGEGSGGWWLKLRRYTKNSQWAYDLLNPQGGSFGSNLSRTDGIENVIDSLMNPARFSVSSGFKAGTPYRVTVDIAGVRTRDEQRIAK